MGALKMELRIRNKVCGWVGVYHFLLMMILWPFGNLNYCWKKKMKLWNIMEISLFSCQVLKILFDDDFATFFKEDAIGEKTIFFVA